MQNRTELYYMSQVHDPNDWNLDHVHVGLPLSDGPSQSEFPIRYVYPGFTTPAQVEIACIETLEELELN